MKGTLYSSDFVKNSSGDLKLLELNTDTDFPSASLSHFDWTPFVDLLLSESIETVHVVHKNFQQYLVSNLSESLDTSNYTGSFLTTLETADTIYPTDVSDSDTIFILRLAYNEAAIFDSEYCKTEIPLYKLFTEATGSETDYIIPHYVSSSAEDYVNNNLSQTFNSNIVPDVALKRSDVDGPKLNFYKIGNESETDANRYSSFISSVYEDGFIISNYIDTSDSTDYMHSYRACNILYGTELSSMNIGMYKIQSWVDKPDDIGYDSSQIAGIIANKHRYEFATNWPKEYWKNQGGVWEESELIDVDGNIVQAKDTVVNTRYQSIDIPGLPDTDNASDIFSWSLDGNTLPEGTSVTSSALVTKDSASVQYGVLTEISSSNDSSILVGSSLPLLVYNQTDDQIEFEYAYNLTTDSYQLLDSTGSLVNIVENNLVIFEGDTNTYELNMETDDTFTINSAGVLLVSHNPFYSGGETCFLAGTQVQTLAGDKNIEDIIVGDIVQGWDSENNRFVTASVTAIDHSHTVGDHLAGCQSAGYGECGVFKLIVDFGDGEGPSDAGFQFTPEHPFLTKEGWKAISPLTNQEPWVSQQDEVLNLEVGDFVKFDDITEEGKWVEIVEIGFEPKEASTPVYNFTVEGISNYCVSYIVAHNK